MFALCYSLCLFLPYFSVATEKKEMMPFLRVLNYLLFYGFKKKHMKSISLNSVRALIT